MSQILTLNAGSSSIKFSVFAMEASSTHCQMRGQVENLGDQATLHAHGADGSQIDQVLTERSDNAHLDALHSILGCVHDKLPGARLDAVSHRVVHGGLQYTQPVVINAQVIAELSTLTALAPLHQPHNLEGIGAAMQALGDVPQIACFDTAFHRQQSFVSQAFALPRSFYEQGVRRYGFHGLSYEFISRQLQERYPELHAGKVIVCHLGNGASMCAISQGQSIASTMGFTALDGLPMGTRCGHIDPGVLLYLMNEHGMNAEQLSDLLYHESGLKGLSGQSHDVRSLLASNSPHARQALNYFVEKCRREIGSLTASLSGLDALVFTGGIGEHAAPVRQHILEGMQWLGLSIDPEANAIHAETISVTDSKIKALVMPTDEEQMLAEHAFELLDKSTGAVH